MVDPTTAPVQLYRTLFRRSTSDLHSEAAGGSHNSAATDLQSRIIQANEMHIALIEMILVTGAKSAPQKHAVATWKKARPM